MPSLYFQNFPYRGYTLDPAARPGDYTVVTDIFKRVRLHSSVLADARVYYPYLVKEGDTPENISHRYYGSTDYYWVILMVNEILDPLREWPKSYQSFLNYIRDVYGSIEVAQTTIHHYEKIITKTNTAGEVSTETFVVDETLYDSLVSLTPDVYTFADGTTVTATVTRNAVDCFTYEDTMNEASRQILLLKNEYIPQIRSELEFLLGV